LTGKGVKKTSARNNSTEKSYTPSPMQVTKIVYNIALENFMKKGFL